MDKNYEQTRIDANRYIGPSLCLLVGFVGGYAIRFASEDSSPETETLETFISSVKKKDFIGSTVPCRDEPLRIKYGDISYLIADARCNSEKETSVEIHSFPTDSILGPIATVETGTIVEAVCVTESQKIKRKLDTEVFTSSEWIKVSLTDSAGVIFKSDKSEGYINSLDVIGENELPVCEQAPTQITREV